MDDSKRTCLLRFRLILGKKVQIIQNRIEDGKIKLKNFDCNSYRELLGIDGEPIEFEWNLFPGLTSLEILQKCLKDLQDRNTELGNFEQRIIFMSTFNDIDWTKRGNSERCI